jgi:zinc and cadmium transporter
MVLEYILASVALVSLLSLIGVVSFAFKIQSMQRLLLLLVSFAAGALLGDAFIHLIPEAFASAGLSNLQVSLLILFGILVFFILEKAIHYHQCPNGECDHKETLGVMNLAGSTLHNFIDGVVVAGSYLVSIPLGVSTTLAVLLHEIPHEFSDFAILLHAGYSKKRALVYNFFSALAAVLGALITIALSSSIQGIELALIPFTAGGFIYIALGDLLPEFKRESQLHISAIQVVLFMLGMLLMVGLLLLESP